MGDGFDAAEIIFQGEVFVGGMSVFVGQAEADQDAGHLEGVVHLRDERDRAAFADEDSLFAKAFFQRGLRFRENRSLIRSGPGFAGAEDFEFADHGFRQQLADVLLHELGDLLRILIGHQARGEFRPGF